MVYDLVMIFIAYNFSFYLRLGEAYLPSSTFLSHVGIGLIITITQFFTIYSMGVYRGIWRYSSTPDLVRLIKAASFAILISFTLVFFLNRLENTPRSIFIIDWFILTSFLGGGRLSYRILRDYLNTKGVVQARKVLIVGAGSSGEQLFREIRKNPELQLNVVGFIDDDRGKKNKILHGVKVLGTTNDIPNLVASFQVTELFLAIPSATKAELKKVLELCRDCDAQIKTLPKISDIIHGNVSVDLLRNISIEDLLGREEINLDFQSIQKMIHGKRVLVTGAAGSIGSELCRQVLKFNPHELICFDISEYHIYLLEQELKHEECEIHYQIGDARSLSRMESLFKSFKIDIVFHAAAYKHVPLMEKNPLEAIKTNVLGTKVVSSTANKFGVEKFVLISTDKAVNPTNIMGTTKRLAEMVLQFQIPEFKNMQAEIVRFGNVIGSSGSVVPLFQKQIDQGGPITVTHPEVTRFFMSISEAAQLVLQAGAIGNGGELFLLEMGEPVKIVELARQMIRLAGLREGEDIQINYVGLRPGEKLYEELLLESEETITTPHPKIRVAKPRKIDEKFKTCFDGLDNPEDYFGSAIIRESLKELVPEYKPVDNEKIQ